MKSHSKYVKIIVVLLSLDLLFACSKSANLNEASTGSAVVDEEVSKVISEKVPYDEDDFYTDWESENPTYIELDGANAIFDASAAVIFSNQVLTIKASGVYVLSGKLNDGQIVVEAVDKKTVKLVLNGVEITSSNTSALHIKNAEKTVISLVDGTENSMTDGKEYLSTDSSDEPNATIFSKDDLTINGNGKLKINGNYNNGLTSKDELKITGGDISIKATDDGVMGRDLVAVKEGNISIKAGGDGIKSTNDEDTTKGSIVLEGGSFDIVSGNDGIQAISSLAINDGSYTITTGGGSPETIANFDSRMQGSREDMTTETPASEVESESFKGLKASVDLTIAGGTFDINSSDDAVHSNQNIIIAGGEMKIASGDDGIHADSSVVTKGGEITITKSYEGIEGNIVTINDGTIRLTSSDDGINVAGGNDGSGIDMNVASSETSMLTINGGTIFVNADGDGLDANGSITMTDGQVVVNGPTNSGNGSLDYDGTFDITGGTIVASGSSGMAQAASEQSSQYSILMSFPEIQTAGTLVHLEDSEGKQILTYLSEKEYQSIFFSSPDLQKDSSYTLFTEGSADGEEINGIYMEDINYQEGTKVLDFTLSTSVTWLNESGITTAHSSGGPGVGGFNSSGEGHMGVPERGNMTDIFQDLDEGTIEKVQAIMDQERAGTITREEAQVQLEELGVELSRGGGIRP
ncbi:carbohydrate-binding domain-containing protein [Metabacillus litoralis]|uniref:carbohydrate-binding domain-containing protein n=1 Tax=Metabacillus litoralis TaxID=152268 RepID=UPI001CFE783B|nr:carbohydrate-binding domain-containing protein [Metabacillus litoralis]